MEHYLVKMDNEKIKFFKKYLIYPVQFILSLLALYFIYNLVYDKEYQGYWNIKSIIFIVILLIPIIFIIVKTIREKNKKLEKIFLSFIIPIGLAYLIFVLPIEVPDEESHIYRANSIGVGRLIVNLNEQKEYIPKDLKEMETIKSYRQLTEMAAKDTDFNSEEVTAFNTFQTYAPTTYICSSVAFFIGNILNLNVVITVFLARIFNFILFLVLGYYSIKLIPFGKLLMFTYLCMPMILQQAASVSADIFINGMALLFIAFSLKLLTKLEDITKKEKIIYLILSILSTFNKHAYIPLVLIGVLFLFNKNICKRNKIFVAITMIISIFITLAWYMFGSQYIDVRDYVIENNVNSSEQVKYIISNPIEFIKVMYRTLNLNVVSYLYQMVGMYLGRLDVIGNPIIYTVYLILILLSTFLEKSDKEINIKQKIWLILIMLGSSLLIISGLYLGWTTVGGSIIEGIQGRYFLPVAILLPMCLTGIKCKKEFKYIIPIYVFLIGTINILTIANVIKCYM